MKKYFNYILLLGYIAFLSGCTKDTEEIPCTSIDVPEDWEKFIGDYKVLDENGEFSHEMKISHVFSGDNALGNQADSLLIENLGGKFDFKFQYQHTTDSNKLGISSINPLADYSEDRWYFWFNADDSETDIRENYFQNDTIHLYYLIDNNAVLS